MRLSSHLSAIFSHSLHTPLFFFSFRDIHRFFSLRGGHPRTAKVRDGRFDDTACWRELPWAWVEWH
jgi:hypothetical protein